MHKKKYAMFCIGKINSFITAKPVSVAVATASTIITPIAIFRRNLELKRKNKKIVCSTSPPGAEVKAPEWP
jgi:uncharacterized membrane protein